MSLLYTFVVFECLTDFLGFGVSMFNLRNLKKKTLSVEACSTAFLSCILYRSNQEDAKKK